LYTVNHKSVVILVLKKTEAWLSAGTKAVLVLRQPYIRPVFRRILHKDGV